MSYFYSDPSRESDEHSLPDVEVFFTFFGECGCTETPGFADTMRGVIECPECGDSYHASDSGYFYAFGFPGCLWDSDPVGPFDTEAAALEDIRE